MREHFEGKSGEGRNGRPRRRRSFFGPIVLIAVGVFFLLRNLGITTEYQLHWELAVQLWPLLLIFGGLNVLMRQIPGLIGALASGLVGVTAVAVFAAILLFGNNLPGVDRLGAVKTGTMQQEIITFAGDGVETAEVAIDLGLTGANIFALENSEQVISGSVSYLNRLVFDKEQTGSNVKIHLGTSDGGFFFLNPANWINFERTDPWEIGLSPAVATELSLDMGAGPVELDLEQLALTYLEVDGGAGSVQVHLPGGEYDALFDVGAGSLQVTLPGNGRHAIDIDGGAGSITLFLPPNGEVRLVVDDGAGSLKIEDGRLRHLSGDGSDEGVWVTPGYETASDRMDIHVDQGAGSLLVEPVSGR